MKQVPSIVFLMGVSGSGKTTIGVKLSAKTGIPFFDGDDFHPQANKEKMKAGQPLTDNDRKDWLKKINELAKNQSGIKGAIIACSALKEKYRADLSAGIKTPVYWVLLQGDFELIRKRMESRKDHFMPASLLQSQFETLEAPADALVIDIKKSPHEIVDNIIGHLKLIES